MKKAAKIFVIIGMVVGWWTILPLIFGILALKKLNNATSRSELTGTGILTLLFVSVIGGILILCMRDEHLRA